MTPPGALDLTVFLSVVAFAASAVVGVFAYAAPVGHRGKAGVTTTLAVVAWVAVSSVPTAMGWVTAAQPLPLAPLVMVGMFALVTAVVLSPYGARVAMRTPLWMLVGVQAFRIPLEWVLHFWSQQGTAPVQMSWHGQNLDVVAGVVCLICAPFAARSRWAAVLSQAVGIALLANVLRIVARSLPTPMQAYPDPLLLPFHIPTLWIATVCVGTAMLFHGLTVRRLLATPTHRA